MNIPAVREAMILIDHDLANKEDIDLAMKLGACWPMGPFEMADNFGLEKINEFLTKLESESGACYSVPKYLG